MEFGFMSGWVKYDLSCGSSDFPGLLSGSVVFFSSAAGVSSMSYLAPDVLNIFQV